MAAYGIGPAGVTTVTPASRESYEKLGLLEVADGSTGFAATTDSRGESPLSQSGVASGGAAGGGQVLAPVSADRRRGS